MLHARRRTTVGDDTAVKARDVDVVHRAVSSVGNGRLEIDAHDGRRGVGIVGSHDRLVVDAGGSVDECYRMLVVKLALMGEGNV